MRSEAEIRAEAKQTKRLLDHMMKKAGQGDIKGLAAETIAGRLDTRVKTLEWVLNDPTPINTSEGESKAESSGG